MGMEMPNSFKIQDPARTDTTQITKQYRATFLAAFFLSGRFRPVSRGSTINAEPTGFTAGKSEKNPTNTSCRKGKLNDIDVMLLPARRNFGAKIAIIPEPGI